MGLIFGSSEKHMEKHSYYYLKSFIGCPPDMTRSPPIPLCSVRSGVVGKKLGQPLNNLLLPLWFPLKLILAKPNEIFWRHLLLLHFFSDESDRILKNTWLTNWFLTKFVLLHKNWSFKYFTCVEYLLTFNKPTNPEPFYQLMDIAFNVYANWRILSLRKDLKTPIGGSYPFDKI